MLEYQLPTPQATLELGKQCAHWCSNECVFYLQGPLGSGKTTFTRGFLQALGGFTSVKSPTYTLIEPYITSTNCVLHLDLYRLTQVQDLEMLGLADYTLTPSIWLIEWAERVDSSQGIQLLPPPDIRIHFRLLPRAHQLRLHPISQNGLQLLNNLKKHHNLEMLS